MPELVAVDPLTAPLPVTVVPLTPPPPPPVVLGALTLAPVLATLPVV